MARAKGTAMLQMAKALRSLPESSRGKVPQALQRYLRERILPSTWYPEEDYLALITTLGQLWPTDGGDVFDQFGTRAAQHDLTGIYRGMMKRGTVLGTLKAIKDLFTLYHDTGRVETSGDERHALLDIIDYPSVSADHCRFLDAYCREHLRLSLGREVAVRETQCRARGDTRCRREIQR
ncbi:MAG TPA: hypothetical protein VFF06_20515 [Polyangia bacterium]|nr:hypothetical protein [Polyangia bacterium]